MELVKILALFHSLFLSSSEITEIMLKWIVVFELVLSHVEFNKKIRIRDL